jgi:hypothetical protein
MTTARSSRRCAYPAQLHSFRLSCEAHSSTVDCSCPGCCLHSMVLGVIQLFTSNVPRTCLADASASPAAHGTVAKTSGYTIPKRVGSAASARERSAVRAGAPGAVARRRPARRVHALRRERHADGSLAAPRLRGGERRPAALRGGAPRRPLAPSCRSDQVQYSVHACMHDTAINSAAQHRA